MAQLTYGQVNDDVLGAMGPPSRAYWVTMACLGTGMALALVAWIVQVKTGMGLAGISHPVGWGVYIANFIFWVGIAHSGTLISAILHLVRARWRDAVSRAAEAMTVFAVMTAGLFPLVHLGRLWVFYYIIPYPSERQLWPNFTSPLVWDVVAISTYLTVSSIFFLVGLVPDLAAARDRFEITHGPHDLRTRLYRFLSFGWCGAASQWRHYTRGYLFFAALATPLVISVHSVVSWDFAMSVLPGWHTTIFAPYFVAGAIHSGLAMVVVLLIPMRKLLHLERLITVEHFEAAALTMLVTTAIVGYAYVVEPFMAWYSGDLFEKAFALWRTEGFLALMYWLLWPLNVFIPLLFLFKKVRRNLGALFVIAILVNVGMWCERVFIVVGSTAHDFLPHNWGGYFPRPVEIIITLGSFCFFLFWFFVFAKLLPTVPAVDIKGQRAEEETERVPVNALNGPVKRVGNIKPDVLAVYSRPDQLVEALEKTVAAGYGQIETFAPVRIEKVHEVLGHRPSPVRYWTLIGAIAGLVGGFGLAIGSALVNGLIVGGKPVISIIPFCVIGFEGTILLGTFGTLAGVLYHARLGRSRLLPGYDRRFSRGKFGLLVACPECGPAALDQIRQFLATTNPEEIHVID